MNNIFTGLSTAVCTLWCPSRDLWCCSLGKPAAGLNTGPLAGQRPHEQQAAAPEDLSLASAFLDFKIINHLIHYGGAASRACCL